MFSRRTIRVPGTGLFQTPVCTVRPLHGTSLGIPTLTDNNVAIVSHLPICPRSVEAASPASPIASATCAMGAALSTRGGSALSTGLLDELHVDITAVLLGSGVRPFGSLPGPALPALRR